MLFCFRSVNVETDLFVFSCILVHIVAQLLQCSTQGSPALSAESGGGDHLLTVYPNKKKKKQSWSEFSAGIRYSLCLCDSSGRNYPNVDNSSICSCSFDPWSIFISYLCCHHFSWKSHIPQCPLMWLKDLRGQVHVMTSQLRIFRNKSSASFSFISYKNNHLKLFFIDKTSKLCVNRLLQTWGLTGREPQGGQPSASAGWRIEGENDWVEKKEEMRNNWQWAAWLGQQSQTGIMQFWSFRYLEAFA